MNGVEYYYIYNAQGDVVALVDTYGAVAAKYCYDAWGKLIKVTNASGVTITSSTHVGNINPIRYRGYYYDVETGLYYLQSRYYDPTVGRFISADTTDVLSVSPMAIIDKNLYAYCDSEPVNRVDVGGDVWETVFDVGFLAWSIADVISDPSDWRNWAALGVDALFAVIPFVPSGVGQIIKVGNKVDNAVDVANAINRIDNLANANKVTLIGRNMDRVTSTANLIGKADNLYTPWKSYSKYKKSCGSLADALSATHNGGWLYGKLRRGYTVIDIGITTSHTGRGLWYGTERFVLGVWKTRNIWKLPIHFSPKR